LFANNRGIFADIAAKHQKTVSCLRFPIPDMAVPDVDIMNRILYATDKAIKADQPV
jgi:hypothetical protein